MAPNMEAGGSHPQATLNQEWAETLREDMMLEIERWEVRASASQGSWSAFWSEGHGGDCGQMTAQDGKGKR